MQPVALAEAPSGARIVLGHFLDDLNIDRGRQLGAAERTRQQQAKQPALDQRFDDRLGKFAAKLDFLGRRVELGTKLPRALDMIQGKCFSAPHFAGGRAHCWPLSICRLISNRLILSSRTLSLPREASPGIRKRAAAESIAMAWPFSSSCGSFRTVAPGKGRFYLLAGHALRSHPAVSPCSGWPKRRRLQRRWFANRFAILAESVRLRNRNR